MSTRLEPRDTGEALEKLLIEEDKLKKLLESYQLRIHDLEAAERNHISTIASLNSQLRDHRKSVHYNTNKSPIRTNSSFIVDCK